MTTIATPDTCKTVVQDSAIQIAVNHLLHIRPEKSVLFRKTLVIDLLQRFKMTLNALIIR